MRINEVENESPQRLLNLEHYKELNKVFENKDEEKKWLEDSSIGTVKLQPSWYLHLITYVSNQPLEIHKDEQPVIIYFKFLSK